MFRPPRPQERLVIGWREWIALPDLGIAAIKAKVDTGARTSSLHAFDLETFTRRGRKMVRFCVHPFQRNTERTVCAEAEIHEFRRVKSSSGHTTLRPVILTDVSVLGRQWTIELTLANRDEMGFRMLLGRQAVRETFLVDSGRSFYGGRPASARRGKKRRRSASKFESDGSRKETS